MPETREIPHVGWDEFLHRFTHRNRGRLARLEVKVQPGEGQPVVAEHEPLLSLDVDRKGSGAPAITVALGGTEAFEPRLTHIIRNPTRLWAEETADGLGIALEIDSSGDGKTLLLFERTEALPERGTVTARA